MATTLVGPELLGLIVAEPMNLYRLMPALDALVIREPRSTALRLEHDSFWAKFA